MKSPESLQRFWRKLEINLPNPVSILRRLIWQLRGARIGPKTVFPLCYVTWPHQVQIGTNCILHRGIFFNYDHYWTPGPSIIIGDNVFIGRDVEFNCRERITVGDDALIAAGCRFVDHNHGTSPGTLMRLQDISTAPIVVGKGAWLGANVIVLQGVTIGDGAIIGAGAVLTKSVPPGESWAGVPAKRIGSAK